MARAAAAAEAAAAAAAAAGSGTRGASASLSNRAPPDEPEEECGRGAAAGGAACGAVIAGGSVAPVSARLPGPCVPGGGGSKTGTAGCGGVGGCCTPSLAESRVPPAPNAIAPPRRPGLATLLRLSEITPAAATSDVVATPACNSPAKPAAEGPPPPPSVAHSPPTAAGTGEAGSTVTCASPPMPAGERASGGGTGSPRIRCACAAEGGVAGVLWFCCGRRGGGTKRAGTAAVSGSAL